MRNKLLAKTDYYSHPFVSDEELFRQNPHEPCRVRHWRDDCDFDRAMGSWGDEAESFWITIAWPDGTISQRYFPFWEAFNRRQRRHWFKGFEKELLHWIEMCVKNPNFR